MAHRVDGERYARAQEYTRAQRASRSWRGRSTSSCCSASGSRADSAGSTELVRGSGSGTIATGLVVHRALAARELAPRPAVPWYHTFVLEERFGFNRTTRARSGPTARRGSRSGRCSAGRSSRRSCSSSSARGRARGCGAGARRRASRSSCSSSRRRGSSRSSTTSRRSTRARCASAMLAYARKRRLPAARPVRDRRLAPLDEGQRLLHRLRPATSASRCSTR